MPAQVRYFVVDLCPGDAGGDPSVKKLAAAGFALKGISIVGKRYQTAITADSFGLVAQDKIVLESANLPRMEPHSCSQPFVMPGASAGLLAGVGA